MRHELKIEYPRRHAEKKKLFADIYTQVDTAFSSIDLKDRLNKEKWRQIRKIIGEYTGNLYKWDKVATFVDVEISVNSSQVMYIQIVHDGEPFDQKNDVETIKAGLKALGACPMVAHGSGEYDGFSIEVNFKK